MKCDKCGTDMFWHGSMRDGHMACGYCQLCVELPVMEVEIFNAQAVDPAVSDDFPLDFYVTASGHSVGEDDVQCKRCSHVFAHASADTFAICNKCGFAGRKEVLS